MKKVKSFKQLIKCISRYNIIRLNKPHIIGIIIHPDTWIKLIKDEVYIVHNLGIALNNNVPEDLICTYKGRKSDPSNKKEMKIIKIKSFEDLEKNIDHSYPINMHPETYKRLKGEGDIIVTNLHIFVSEQVTNRTVKTIPGIIGDTYEIFRDYEGTVTYVEDEEVPF